VVSLNVSGASGAAILRGMGVHDLNDAPQGGAPKWILGVVLPGLMAGYAIAILAKGRFALNSRAGPVEFHGSDAAAWGVLIVAAAAGIHCHFFWGNTTALAQYADLGKAASFLLVALSAAYLAWRVFTG